MIYIIKANETEMRLLLDELAIPSEHIVYGRAVLGYEKEEGEPKDMSNISEIFYGYVICIMNFIEYIDYIWQNGNILKKAVKVAILIDTVLVGMINISIGDVSRIHGGKRTQ